MLDAETLERWFDPSDAFANPVTVACVGSVGALLAIAGVAIASLGNRWPQKLSKEIRTRYISWVVIAPFIVVPILLGAFWAVVLMLTLSLLMYREFARATGLFRHRLLSVIVVACIALIYLAVFDNWYGLFVAMGPLTIAMISVASISQDRPEGFIQRVALGSFAFLLFGSGMGHMAYMTNSSDYRPLLLVIFLCVQFNDIAAFCAGKLFGRRQLAPRTSPNKTYAGSLGAIAVTTPLAAALVSPLMEGTRGDSWLVAVTFGLIVSVGGQFGDLFVSSIKRDLGVKDMGVTIPGHGGFLDRFDSILIVGPAAFHFIGFFTGIGLDQTVRVFSRVS